MNNDSLGPRLKGRRGSALLTAVIFSTVILLGIAGVMPMLVNDWKQTTRTSLQEAAFTLAVSAGTEVARYIETEFRKPNPAGYGLVARDTLNFNGRPSFDSYDSREFPYVYSYNVNSGNEGVVGSTSTDVTNTLDLGNAIIDMDLATGGADNGTNPAGSATVSGEIIWEFEMDFPRVKLPNTSGWNRTAP